MNIWKNAAESPGLDWEQLTPTPEPTPIGSRYDARIVK